MEPASTKLPDPPYYAVIFTSSLESETSGYAEMSERMVALASTQPGFLGIESARGADGFGVTVSYWRSTKDVANWRAHAEHQVAQAAGRERWYESYEVRIAKVERAYSKPPGAGR